LGRPLATGREVGRFIRRVRALGESAAMELLVSDYGLDTLAARNLLAYLEDELEATGILPTDETLVIERFRDEIGDWRVVILSPLGAKVHAPWAMALTQKLRSKTEVDVIWTDDGIAFRFPDSDRPPADLGLEPEEVEGLLLEHLADTALFGARFREAAGRALLLPRRKPGSRTPLWQRRRRAASLLAVAKQFGDFPIVLEAYREILRDDFDLPALIEVLTDIRARRIRVAEVEVSRPSPFATSLLFAFVASYLYEGDTPLAERRVAALTLDRQMLSELLGEAELRELLSGEVITAVELELQHLTAERQARGADGIHDLLRHLGPLTTAELQARTADTDVVGALGELEASRRGIRVLMAGDEHWAAIEDAARLRDALGVQPPPGVPFSFLEPVPDPLGDVVGRYARTHGPFTTGQAAGFLGLPSAVVDQVLLALEARGQVVRGSFRPGDTGTEWTDTEVLRRIKRRSLAVLRKSVEPVEASVMGRFLPAWSRAAGEPARGRPALAEAVRRLQGAEVPASVLERDVLACRVADAGPLLDRLMLEGDLVWAGRGPLGQRDGRVALYFRQSLPLLWRPVADLPLEGELHQTVRRVLAEAGASFFRDIYLRAGGGDPDAILDALWDLVWAGEITNDTMAPLRSFISGRRHRVVGPPVLAGSFPPHAAGRWSLLTVESASPTAAAAAWAEQLLDRHGVLTRPTVAAEEYPGGFAALYPVLDHLEETGRVRRGYFVEGLGGAQFAKPGAVDRLRSPGDVGMLILAATDPANPYGAVLPWPESVQHNVHTARVAGAYVLLAGGRLVGYLERGRRRLTLFEDEPDLFGQVARHLAAVASRHHRFVLETVNAQPASRSPLTPALTEWGFAAALRGLAYRG
jgi:ATP-dependent Lhr-like helicase